MVQPGDKIVFPEIGTFEDPETGSQVTGETTSQDRIVSVEPRDQGGFGSIAPEGEIGLRLEQRGTARLSEIGSRPFRRDVTADDVFVRPGEPDSSPENGVDATDDINPQRIHEERSMTSRVADESKDAEITTDASKWASAPDQFDYPGVDTGPQFEKTFEGPFDDF